MKQQLLQVYQKNKTCESQHIIARFLVFRWNKSDCCKVVCKWFWLLSLKCCSGPKHLSIYIYIYIYIYIPLKRPVEQLLSKITVLDAQDKTTTKEMTCMTVWFFHTSCKRCCFHLPRDANPRFWWRSVTATHRILWIFCGSATFVELAIPKQWWKWPRSQCLVTPETEVRNTSPHGYHGWNPVNHGEVQMIVRCLDLMTVACPTQTGNCLAWDVRRPQKKSNILVVALRDDLWDTSFFRSKFISSFPDVSSLINLSHNMKANSVSECGDKIGCVVKTNVLCHL